MGIQGAELDSNGVEQRSPSSPRSRAAIALGSNLASQAGNSYITILTAMDALNAMADSVVESRSSLYRTAAVGPPQPDYFNACVVLSTLLSAPQLMQALLALEQQFGRERLERWGPRTLDLDLLLFDDLIVDHTLVQVPHPRMAERAFVLMPLAEIAPQWNHPILQTSIADLVQHVSREGVQKL